MSIDRYVPQPDSNDHDLDKLQERNLPGKLIEDRLAMLAVLHQLGISTEAVTHKNTEDYSYAGELGQNGRDYERFNYEDELGPNGEPLGDL